MRPAGMTKSGWKNADNFISVLIQVDGAAKNVRIGAEAFAPKAVANNDRGRETGCEVAGAI
jgi:hypothetical protein